MTAETGDVITVEGPLPAAELGACLTHEHLLTDVRPYFQEDPDPVVAQELAGPITLSNVGLLRRSLVNSVDDLHMSDDDVASAELSRLTRWGPSSICEMSTYGIRVPGQALRLREIARRAGVNVVMGTGNYVDRCLVGTDHGMDEDAAAERFIEELTVGVEQTGVRCGVIGEVGLSVEPTQREINGLRAAARAQVSTGAAMVIHQVDRTARTADWCLNQLESMGVAPSRVVIAHVALMEDLSHVYAILRRGAYIALDTFGHNAKMGDREEASDVQLAKWLVALVEAGHANRLLISHDIGHKRHLRTYGGFGFDHIQLSVLPMLGSLGLGSDTIDRIMVANPAELLPFRP